MAEKDKKIQIFNGNVAAVAGNDITIEALYINGVQAKSTREMVGELMQFHNQSELHRLALKSYAQGTHGSSFYNDLNDNALADMLAFKNILANLLLAQQTEAANGHTESLDTAQRQADHYRALAEKRCPLCRWLRKS